ncbi:MAG: hypothetical protein HOQ22_11745 [Nocardioidaceae bacterium]|nr:hypothetical protein [Nocardioidaceae bacterium]NUS51696.1 hypothetical protein [Nocardioidaceae bacterium]
MLDGPAVLGGVVGWMAWGGWLGAGLGVLVGVAGELIIGPAAIALRALVKQMSGR